MKWLSLSLMGALVALLTLGMAFARAGPDAALMGTYWRAVAIDGTAVAPQPKPREAHLVFAPQGFRVSGSTGCNRVTGTFAQTAESFRFSQMASTKMACPPPLDSQERAFLKALDATVAVQISGNTLELKDSTGKVRLRFEACSR
jgi:copper homeostasis protein (lipoprotein)/putative lipoprotein